MEQGTGKTRTALELIKIRLEKGRVNHVVWLCPCSVKENLRRDIILHAGTDHNELITIVGIETLSSSIRVNSELLELVEAKDCYLIVDESNLVKNHMAKRTRNIIRLAEKCKYKLILNGTPISRNEADLYAQWYVLDWRILGYKSYWSFAANHLEFDEKNTGRIRKTLNVDYLAEKIAPYTYQVKKDECLDLPAKTYETVYYFLDDEQNKHYDEVAEKLLFDVDEMEPHQIYRLFTGLQNVISGYKVDVDVKITKTEDMFGYVQYYKSVKGMKKSNFFKDIRSNPRIQILLDTIANLEKKIIVFCKYTDEINSIVEVLNEEYGEGSAVPFNGELNLKKRQSNLDKFRNDARFLVANKTCAGYGLNLQFCNYIIYYSNDWDYATRSQSEDRVHRIGQDENVHIIDICASYTLDERILNCLTRKENLVDSFKSEIDKTKDKKDLIEWIYTKNSRGRTVGKKAKKIDVSDIIEDTGRRKNMKVYTDKNVLDAAYERLEYIFNEFDNVYFSLSGGKDSSVMIQLANIVAKKMNKKFDVLHIDLEAWYKATDVHLKELKKLSQINNFYHVCLEFTEDNAVSQFEPTWITWDEAKKKDWIRPMPKGKGVININNNIFPFYERGMIFEDFVVKFAEWYRDENKGSVGCGVAIRTQESLNRFRSLVREDKAKYNDLNWTTKISDDIYNFYPVYDWETEDIWCAVANLDFSFNEIYELMYKNGVGIHQQRLCQPFGFDQRVGLDQFKALEPDTWEKLLNRVSGVNMGQIYCRTELLGHIKTSKPSHMSWEEYTMFLLESVGMYSPEIMEHYVEKIERVFWWHENKCGTYITDDDEHGKDKNWCSWKLIARAIEKNDFWMKRLSFGETKAGYEKLKAIREKYKNILDINSVDKSLEKAEKIINKE